MKTFNLTDIVVYEGSITMYGNIKEYIDMVYFNNCQVDIDIRLANDEEIKRYNERS